MKIILTEEQVKKILEQRVEFTPERIDEIVEDGKRKLVIIKNLINSYKNKILSFNIGDILDNSDKIGNFIREINDNNKKINKISQKYYDIVKLYSNYDEYPENIGRLDDISSEMDDLSYKFNDFSELLSSILNFSDKLD